MKILLHICCANCLDQTLNGLKAELGDDLEVSGFFYNPNIHPLLEFRKRLKAVKVINESLKLDIEYDETYKLGIFMHEVWNSGKSGRCRRCYEERLKATAKRAAEGGFDAFSSTLCVSKQQSHEDIRQAAEKASEAWAIPFIYRDLREYVDKTPRRNGIYSQQYCGCIFSEEERFKDTSKELYRGN